MSTVKENLSAELSKVEEGLSKEQRERLKTLAGSNQSAYEICLLLVDFYQKIDPNKNPEWKWKAFFADLSPTNNAVMAYYDNNPLDLLYEKKIIGDKIVKLYNRFGEDAETFYINLASFGIDASDLRGNKQNTK